MHGPPVRAVLGHVQVSKTETVDYMFAGGRKVLELGRDVKRPVSFAYRKRRNAPVT